MFLRKIQTARRDYVAPKTTLTILPPRVCEGGKTFGTRVTTRAKWADKGREYIARGA